MDAGITQTLQYRALASLLNTGIICLLTLIARILQAVISSALVMPFRHIHRLGCIGLSGPLVGEAAPPLGAFRLPWHLLAFWIWPSASFHPLTYHYFLLH